MIQTLAIAPLELDWFNPPLWLRVLMWAAGALALMVLAWIVFGLVAGRGERREESEDDPEGWSSD